MMRPQSTSAARWRRSVAGGHAMGAQRQLLVRRERRSGLSPVSAVSGWKLSRASSTASARSDKPSRVFGRADRAKDVPFVHRHLWRPLLLRRAGLPHGQASATAAQRASLKVAVPCVVALNWAKEIRPPKRRSISTGDSDSDSRKWDSQGATYEKGFRNFVSGAFFFCALLRLGLTVVWKRRGTAGLMSVGYCWLVNLLLSWRFWHP